MYGFQTEYNLYLNLDIHNYLKLNYLMLCHQLNHLTHHNFENQNLVHLNLNSFVLIVELIHPQNIVLQCLKNNKCLQIVLLKLLFQLKQNLNYQQIKEVVNKVLKLKIGLLYQLIHYQINNSLLECGHQFQCLVNVWIDTCN